MRFSQVSTIATALLGVLVLSIGCSHSRDSALQQALDELIKLQSACAADISYEQFDTRFLTAKGNIDAALSRASDHDAKDVIDRAISEYESARRLWNSDESDTPNGLSQKLSVASEYVNYAKSYVFADRGARKRLEAQMTEAEKARAQQLDEKLKALRAEAKEQASFQRELDADRDRLTKEKNAEAAARDRTTAAEAAARERTIAAKAALEGQAESEADKQRLAESAQREHKRRFAPDGVVYNIKPIKIVTGKRSTIIAAETALVLEKKNEDGTLHVKWNELETDVPADDVTNDRDWLAAHRNLDTGEGR
jgi:hypothetical protein